MVGCLRHEPVLLDDANRSCVLGIDTANERTDVDRASAPVGDPSDEFTRKSSPPSVFTNDVSKSDICLIVVRAGRREKQKPHGFLCQSMRSEEHHTLVRT